MIFVELAGVPWGVKDRGSERRLHVRTMTPKGVPKAKLVLEGYGGKKVLREAKNTGVDLQPVRHWLSVEENRRRVEDAWICYMLHRGWLRVEPEADTITVHPGHPLEDAYPLSAFFDLRRAELTFDGRAVGARVRLADILWCDPQDAL
jgi:hypothetical protein